MTSPEALDRQGDREAPLISLSSLTGSKSASIYKHSTGAKSNLTPDNEITKKHLLYKISEISADEPRLLGGPGQPIDPNAVPISKPGAKHPVNATMRIPSGFQPTNTLTQTTRTPLVASQNYSAGHQNHNPRKRNNINTLEFKISAGDNVKSRANGSGIASSQFSEPQAKRPKYKSSLDSDSLNNPNDFDPLSEGQDYSISHVSTLPKSKQEAGSQGRSVYCLGSKDDGNAAASFLNVRIPEYGLVEKTMDSNKKGRGRPRYRKGIRTQGSTSANALCVSNPSSPLDKIPVLAHSDVEFSEIAERTPRQKYRGTARTTSNDGIHKDPMTNRKHGERDTSETSTYFQDGGRRRTANISIQMVRKTQAPNLRDQFRDVDGNPRGSGVDSLSSDELGSCTTVGGHAIAERASPQKSSRSTSPAKTLYSTQQASALRDINLGLPPSNIPCSNFIGHKAGILNKRNSIRKAKNATGQGQERFSNIELDGYIEEGKLVEKKCHLVFNAAEKLFSIFENEDNLALKNPNLQFRLQKLQKISWSTDSPKVYLESSKCKNLDNVLAIELRGGKGVADFVRDLQWGTTLKTQVFPNELMEKIFEKKLSEQKKYPRTNGAIHIEEPLDVQLSAKNLQHRKAAPDYPSEQTHTKRRRIVDDRFTGDNNNQAKKRLDQRQPKSETIFEDILKEPINIKDELWIEDEEKPPVMDTQLPNLQSQTPNRHLRSSRNQAASESKYVEDTLVAAEEFPQSLRFSISVGLGAEWKKPLLYPKNGKKKNTVDWLDLERLDEGQFLNDNLIGFYLRFLEHQLEETRPELAKKVYFFNTFFFASLTNTQERQKLINYEAVQKWTRSVDIFTYDYIVVPINESSHWYVAIICNTPALVSGTIMSDEAFRDAAISSPNHDEHYDRATSPPVESEGPGSSPTAGAVEPDYISLVAENLNDHDPTASFAEMTLENGSEEPTGSGNEADCSELAGGLELSGGIDQGMLNAQIAENIAESTAQQGREASQEVDASKENNEDEHAAQNQTPRPSTLSRKRKRKSFAPILKHNPNSPTIVTFDSLGLTHTPTTKVLKEYLLQEGRTKRGFDWDELPIRGITAKEIPQQTNFCDCGLFLLGYIDKFLDDPKEFISKIIKREYDPKTDWPRLNPSDLRASIREQIQELHVEQEAERKETHKEIAKKANKYHPKHDINTQSLSKDSAPLDTRQPETKKSLPSVAVVISENLSIQSTPTRANALESALAIDQEVTMHPIQTAEGNFYQGGEDILEDDYVSAMHDDPSVVILDSQSDKAESKFKNEGPSTVYVAVPPLTESLAEVEKVPSVIQDSQPDFFRASPAENSPKIIPQPSSPKIEDSPRRVRARSPFLGHESEKLQSRRASPSSKPPSQKQREHSVIDLD